MTTPAGGTGPESGNANGGQPQEGGQQQGQQGGTGQESGTPSGQQGTGAPEGTPDLTAITDPVLRGWVEAQAQQAAEARREAARYRTERNTLQQQQEAARQQGLTAEQQAQEAAAAREARTAALEQENRDLKVNGAVTTAATAAQAHDPSTVLALIGSQITLDAEGKPTNLDTLLTKLKTDKPFLFRRTRGADAGAGGGDTGGVPSSMNDGIRAALRGRRGQAQQL